MIKKPLIVSLIGLTLATPILAQGVPVTLKQAEGTLLAPTQVLVGKMEAKEHTQLTARVSGYLLTQHFADGAEVKAGDVIFQIDPVPYQQAHSIAEAQYMQAEAALQQAMLTFERMRDLQGSGGASLANLDDATATLAMSQAQVAAARAALEKAQDDLAYTKVRAPYDGKLGKSRFSKGDLVAPGAGPMIDLAQTHPILANFSMNFEQYVASGISSDTAVKLVDSDRSGSLAFTDNKINPASGTIDLYALFDNSDYRYKPHQIVRVEVTDQTTHQGVWLPLTAVGQDLQSQFVYVANGGKAERRVIDVKERTATDVFVVAGVEAGENVVIDGLLRVRPGAPLAVQ
ncbi:efflux RND transporter periplasmic adaptor subunit [Ferrimonas pelagia]|uniref:Efflux RND transporter periplasmic adaptor subunit n=1 Tax=Ferrimonas pelagia TaxID=1177826 RepID=A0ABP9F446_9GAMM